MPCGVCGVEHPHLVVCPYVLETEQREEYEWHGLKPIIRVRVVRTVYAPRAELMAAILDAEDDRAATPDGTGPALSEGGPDPALGGSADSQGHEPHSPSTEQPGLALDRS